MLAVVRKKQIKKILFENRNVTVIELAKIFSVTHETIRRDLKDLELAGIAQRTHGGAVLKEGLLNTLEIDKSMSIVSDSEKYMAKLAKSLFNNGQCIFLDATTTTLQTVREMAGFNITVVTNSLDALYELSKYTNIKVICAGGVYNTESRSFVGSMTYNSLRNYYFDLVLFSCKTLNALIGITEVDTEEAEVKRIALSRSRKAALMADHSKFDNSSFSKICEVKDIHYLITDKPLAPLWIKYLKNNNVEYIV